MKKAYRTKAVGTIIPCMQCMRTTNGNSQIRKIAIFRALYLGDLLCIIPTVRSIRAAYPQAEIIMIGLPWQRQFVERFQHYFDRFVEFPGWPGLPEQSVNVKIIPEFLKRMQQEEFDLVLQMQGNGVGTNLMCSLFGAKKLAGLRRKDDWCTDEDMFPVSEDTDHEVLRFLKIADALGVDRLGNHLEFPVLPDEQKAAGQYLKKWDLLGKPFICVHPGARDPRRRWSSVSFARVADFLVTSGFAVILTGSEFEADILRGVAEKMQNQSFNLVDDFGQIPIGELAALIKGSSALLSNDTGVSHIASALNVPSVILFSPYSKPERWAPLDNSKHKVISHSDASDHNLVFNLVMNLVSVSSRREQVS